MTLLNVEQGDWVQGRSREGALVHGYVKRENVAQGLLKVAVIESDQEELIGKAIWILTKSVKKLSMVPNHNEAELLSLIDIALVTKDEQWFTELSEALRSIQTKSKGYAHHANTENKPNRIADIDTKANF
ncbi:IDEAL domain-containing protein [Neobacillus jeddahensis]|uniref:IDEAL domain-containing protein n=1 Tax=Neobacillus jeddahensis TaxID=1461580 RepID=UPI00058FB8D7|nr:IDEAL domain-containing protein [Neobacillus jeddahensis]